MTNGRNFHRINKAWVLSLERRGHSHGVHGRFVPSELMLLVGLPLTTPLPYGSERLPSRDLHTSAMGSSSSSQHHFAFQNAEKGTCFPPSELALVPKVHACCGGGEWRVGAELLGTEAESH